MPLVNLEPGQSIILTPNEDPKDPDAVSNPNSEQGQYTEQANGSNAVIQKFIPPGGYQPFLSPAPEEMTIRNNGEVNLGIKTPGD